MFITQDLGANIAVHSRVTLFHTYVWQCGFEVLFGKAGSHLLCVNPVILSDTLTHFDGLTNILSTARSPHA